MRESQTSQAWIALSDGLLIWEEFAEELVVFNGLSGQTHFLNVTAAEILRLLQGRPHTEEELSREMAELFEQEHTSLLSEQTGRAIQEFAQEGLICPV
jgi:PqqD family protein of HPr-rel-A system